MAGKMTFLFGFVFLLFSSCKPDTSTSVVQEESPFKPRGGLADIVYNPVRPDGTIDSSYLPVLQWKEDIYDFGEILEGDIISHSFEFLNAGTAPLLILNATSTCGCTIPEWPKEQIAPGKSGHILVKFNSLHKTGQQSKEVTIFANTFPNQTKVIIKGRVTKTN